MERRLVAPSGEAVVLGAETTRTRSGVEVTSSATGESVLVWPLLWQEAAPPPPELCRDEGVLEVARRGRLGPEAAVGGGPYRGVEAPPSHAYAVLARAELVSCADLLREARRARWSPARVAGLVQRVTEILARTRASPLHPDPTTFVIDGEGVASVRSCFVEWILDLAPPDSDRRAPVRRWLAYRPPETLRSAARATRRSTSPAERASRAVYVVGVIAWELLAGRGLFEAPRDRETLVRVARADVPPLTALVPELSSELAGWIHTMLGRDPRRRPTLDAVASAMRAHAGPPSASSVPTSPRALLRE